MTATQTLGAEYVRIVLSRWRLVLAIVVGALLASLGVTAYMAQKPVFEASARLNIVPTSEELGYASRFVRGTTFDGGSTLLGTYAEFAHTRPVVAPIVDHWIAEQARAAGQTPGQWIAANTPPPGFSPRQLYSWLNYGSVPAQPLRDDLIDGVIKYTTIETVEGTYLMKLTVAWDDPQAAAWFSNALADAIIARAEAMSSKSGTEIAGSLQARLAEKQAELDATLRRSRDMKAAAGVVDVDQQKQSLLAAQITEQSQLTSDRAQLQASQSQVAGLRRQSGGKMSTAQAAIDQTIAVEGPKAAGLAQGIAIREGRVAQLRGQIAALGRHEDTIKSLDDRAGQLRAEVAALTDRVSFSQTENLANAPRIQLIERAVAPLTRSSPKLLLNVALGLVAGCALAGCALLLLGEAPGRVRVAENEVEPMAEAEPDASTPPAPEVGEVPQPRRRWSDFVPGGTGNVVEMPRATLPVQPVFATHGSLALARDVEAEEAAARVVEEPVVRPESFPAHAEQPAALTEQTEWPRAEQPTPVRAELFDMAQDRLVDALPFSSAAGAAEEEQLVDKLSANGGEEGAVSPTSLPAEPVGAQPADVMTSFDKHRANGSDRESSVVADAEPQHPDPHAPDPVFGYLLPPPRSGRRYDTREVRGIGVQVAEWLGEALASDMPLTVAATGREEDAQRLYQLLHDYLAAHGRPVLTVDWSSGARALPRGAGKPLIYAGGGFGAGHTRAHRGGALAIAVGADESDALDAEVRRLTIAAGRPVHVVPLGD